MSPPRLDPADISVKVQHNESVSDPSILLLEDDDFSRTLLIGTVEGLGFHKVYSAATASEAAAHAGQTKMDVAILDLHLGGGPTGVDVAEFLREKNPFIGLIFLTSFANPRMVGNHQDLPVGSIYLSKGNLPEPGLLEVVINTVHQSPLASSHKSFLAEAKEGAPKLTGKQMDVMRLVAHGYTNSEIARLHNTTERAVEKGIQRLAAALEISTQPGRNARVLIATSYFQNSRLSP